MKKMISSFGNAVLSREQMKGIKGGVKCAGTWINANGDELSVQENCSGYSVQTCIDRLNARVGHGQADSYSCDIV
ncbi:hypothetical protein Emtol_0117 (plasmid) [Emticicia oligotrophica DSM 17448]|uniref:Bacteriocin n=1 Tax=Emticicia oligotrophica (strain DSM 17448 / CIP 109782 / MTCC 6937 / GPTSA100-15) TaxID=929562 RepID=A0ABM5N822_EMTOG|nr:hypothetical protein [Emticicia oligotrophica]AFK05635.1 hypothetical protein Emtol_0117 [Emticicia oligotrophica DSM 17448]